jgi:hypothetical protein
VLFADGRIARAFAFGLAPSAFGALPVRPLPGLAQGQEPGQPGDDPGSRAFRAIGAMTGRRFPAGETGTVFHRSGCFPEAMNSPLYPNLALVSDRSLRPGPFSHWPVGH